MAHKEASENQTLTAKQPKQPANKGRVLENSRRIGEISSVQNIWRDGSMGPKGGIYNHRQANRIYR